MWSENAIFAHFEHICSECVIRSVTFNSRVLVASGNQTNSSHDVRYLVFVIKRNLDGFYGFDWLDFKFTPGCAWTLSMSLAIIIMGFVFLKEILDTNNYYIV